MLSERKRCSLMLLSPLSGNILPMESSRPPFSKFRCIDASVGKRHCTHLTDACHSKSHEANSTNRCVAILMSTNTNLSILKECDPVSGSHSANSDAVFHVHQNIFFDQIQLPSSAPTPLLIVLYKRHDVVTCSRKKQPDLPNYCRIM